MYIFKKNEIGMSGLYIVFNKGSLYENKGQRGTHHLMEHLLCRIVQNKMQTTFDINGIELNGYTSFEQVCIYISGIETRLNPHKDDFISTLLNGLENLTEDAFNNEKKTVLEEYSDWFTDQTNRTREYVNRKYYNDAGPIGILDEIENFSFTDAIEEYKKNFTKPSYIIEIGKTSHQFSYVSYSQNEPIINNKFGIYNDIIEDKTTTCENKINTIVLIKDLISEEDSLPFYFGVDMLNSGLHSPLYKAIRDDNGLSYCSTSNIDLLSVNLRSYFMASTNIKNTMKLTDVYRNILLNVDKYLTIDRYNIVMNMWELDEEESNILKYKRSFDLIRTGLININDGFNTLKYDTVVDIMKKYIYEDNLLFIKH